MSQPAISAAVPESLQQAPVASSTPQITSGAWPMLTPIPDSQLAAKPPSSSMSLPPQPASGTPLASPRIKPPPGAGSFPHSQAGMPLWQMLGSAANIPAGMFTGKESLDLDVLAKAAVKKRKEQERQSAEAAARDNVIAQLQARAAWQAAISALAQQHAINWLQGTVESEDADYVREHMDIIQRLLSKEDLLPETGARDAQPPGAPANPAADAAAAGQATIIAAVHSAAVEQARGLATAAAIEDPVAAATVTAAAAERAAAVVNAAVTDASNAEAVANSAAAVAALQAAAADGAAPAVVVAQAVNEAARALAAAKAKATATAEAALQAAVAQEQQRVVKKAKQQQHPFLPMAPGLGGLVDYPSDEDSHLSRALTDSQTQPGGEVGQAEVSSAERRALAAQQGHPDMSQAAGQAAVGQAAGQVSGQAHVQGQQHQPACLLPMYSMDHSSSHQQASSGPVGSLGDLQADATGSSPRAGHLAEGAGLVGADMPCSRLSGQQLGEVLDSLRELGSVHMNLSLLSGTGLLGFVDRLKSCAEASIAFTAGTMARQWRRSLACHLNTVSQPWPQRDLQQATNQLLVQCADKWGLSLPPVPDATPAPSTQAFASGSKKKRKRDGWDNKKGGKGVAALLWGSGSAPEARTLHQLSQAKQAETLEARRMKRDLQTLHSDPSTLPKPPAGPTPASTSVAAPQAAAQSGQQDNAGVLPPRKYANQAAAAAADAQLQLPSDHAAAAGTDARGALPAAGTAAAPKLSDGVAKAAPAATITAPDVAVPGKRADGDHKLARAGGDSPPDLLEAEQSSGAKQTAGMETKQMSIPDPHAQAHNAGSAAAGSTEGRQADAAGPALQPKAEGQKAKKQGKAAAAGKPKGKRKPPLMQKATSKRQKQDDRSYLEEPEAAAASAPKRSKVNYADIHDDDDDDDDEEAAISSDEEPAPAAVKSQTKAQTSKAKKASAATAPKSKSAAAKKAAGKASATTAPGKTSAAGKAEKAAGKATGKKAAGKKSFIGAADDDDDAESEDDNSMLGDDTDDKADDKVQTGTEADDEAADEADDPPAAATRHRRVKPKETLKSLAKQSPQKASKPAKQQKLPFSKAASTSPKQSKGSAAAATTAASDGAAEAAAAPIGKAAKAKAGSDRKSAASAERVSTGKEAKSKQSKATPKTLQTQAKVQAKSAKQQKQKTVVDKGDDEGSGEDSDEEQDAEASKPAGSADQVAMDKSPVGRALAYLKEQQKAVAGSSYLQLKPVVLTTCKGTVQRLSKLPGWNRQSIRKKEFATCNEALQACLSKHKEDNAEVTKKRHKKEVSRLLSNLVTAVTGLR